MDRTPEDAGPSPGDTLRTIPAHERNLDGKVVNLAFYRIKKKLEQEGFDLVQSADGKVKLVMRVHR